MAGQSDKGGVKSAYGNAAGQPDGTTGRESSREKAVTKGTPRAPIIAIDGPGGVGKSTLSKLLAEKLGLSYIDTGAMYRAFAVAANDAGVNFDDDIKIERFCSGTKVDYDTDTGAVSVNGVDYTSRIRTQEAGELASRSSSKKPVRKLLTEAQRRLGRSGGVVMEGRDIGTVVFPDADIKFFLDAPGEVRASRRHRELVDADLKKVNEELTKRDTRDTERKNAPLFKAEDAIYIDTGDLSIEEVFGKLLDYIEKKGVIEHD